MYADIRSIAEIVKAAYVIAEREGYCDEFDAMIEELGLSELAPMQEFDVEIMVRHTVRISATSRGAARNADDSYIRSSISLTNSGHLIWDRDYEVVADLDLDIESVISQAVDPD